MLIEAPPTESEVRRMLKKWLYIFQLDDWKVDVNCYRVRFLDEESMAPDDLGLTAQIVHDHNCKLATIRIAIDNPATQVSLDIAHELVHIATGQYDALCGAFMVEHGQGDDTAIWGERHALYEQIAVRISRAFGRFEGLPR